MCIRDRSTGGQFVTHHGQFGCTACCFRTSCDFPTSPMSRQCLLVFALQATMAIALQRLESTALCPDCLKEPVEREYWLPGQGTEPPRLSIDTPNIREVFDAAVRQGKVLILENVTAGASMEGWTCEKFADELPGAKMRREYDWEANPQDANQQMMGDRRWISVKQSGEEGDQRLSEDPDSPPFAPFYWGVRDHDTGDVGDKDTISKVRKLIETSVPKAVDPRNAGSMFDMAEFWLGAKGTGARAHSDSHCVSTLSVVLTGSRRWRIGPIPRMPKGGGRSKPDEVVFDDGVAYKLGWKPLYEFTVNQGEAVLFPPGWVHETFNMDETCTSALTTQLAYPRPATYFREYYSRVSRIGDLESCWPAMVQWGKSVSLFAGADVDQRGVVSEAEAKAAGIPEEVFDFFTEAVSYTHLRAHETVLDLVCRLLLEKKK
eukprot:TRINITY_DN4362_c0_g1_i3.p1 TRINITY_DN4362_c0_g1~~TRINITY_DN4362_c0_g1_i3.p1  ORF type:complete len:432 (-),score=66.70 TRINITY_DN4362_c0_g1_i3:23-1318(-)